MSNWEENEKTWDLGWRENGKSFDTLKCRGCDAVKGMTKEKGENKDMEEKTRLRMFFLHRAWTLDDEVVDNISEYRVTRIPCRGMNGEQRTVCGNNAALPRVHIDPQTETKILKKTEREKERERERSPPSCLPHLQHTMYRSGWYMSLEKQYTGCPKSHH